MRGNYNAEGANDTIPVAKQIYVPDLQKNIMPYLPTEYFAT